MQDKKSYARVIIYSNRAPQKEITGGAARVIMACHPQLWIAPQAEAENKRCISEPIPYQDYKRGVIDGIETITFLTDKRRAESHYNIMSNGVFWPILHSIAPMIQPPNLKHIDNEYQNYKEFISLSNAFLLKLTPSVIQKDDLIWVHDYQCVGIEGDIFSLHTPFPSIQDIKKISVQNTPLAECEFFLDYITKINQYPLVTFQRKRDLANFSETVRDLLKIKPKENLSVHKDADTTSIIPKNKKEGVHITENSRKSTNQKPLLYHLIPPKNSFAEECSKQGMFYSYVTSAIAAPVGGSPINTLKDAVNAESRLQQRIRQPLPKTSNAGVIHFYKKLKSTPESLCFISYHRNDYIKNTHIELQAAEHFFKEHPEEVKNIFFCFILQPTRENSPRYRNYAECSTKQAVELQKQYPNNIHLELNGASHQDIMGLLRASEMAGVTIASKRDGYNLTASEAALAVSDKPDAMMAVILSDGVGAADTLGGSAQTPGAFVISSALSDTEFAHELARTYRQIVLMRRCPEGKAALSARYQTMLEAASSCTAQKYTETVLKTAQALELPWNRTSKASIRR